MNRPLRACITVGLVCLLPGCGKQVPSPWKELGVPAKGLETVSTADGKSFHADYSNEDYRVLEAFKDGLKRGGLDLCGEGFQYQSTRHAFFRRADELWELNVSPLDGGRSSVSLHEIDRKKAFTANACIAEAFEQGIERTGLTPCGERVDQPRYRLKFFRKGEELWKLTVRDFEGGRIGAGLEPVTKEQVAGGVLLRSKCAPPASLTP